jgi:hypothetical protein
LINIKTQIMKKIFFVIMMLCCFTTAFAQQASKVYDTIPARSNLIIKNGDQTLPVYWGCTPEAPYITVSAAIAPNESQSSVFSWITSRFFTGPPLAADAIIVTYFDAGKYGTISIDHKGDSVQIIKWKR